MGGPRLPPSSNFAGAEFVLGLHDLVIDLAREIFGAEYADPRPLSGTHAVTALLMTVTQPGQTVLLQGSSSGGHASMLPICQRLGLKVVDLPYDFERLQIDHGRLDDIDLDAIDLVLVSPSDLLYAPDLNGLVLPDRTLVIYDATQSLGLIASGHAPNPFQSQHRIVVTAGTHKTLPGPSSGLILTNDSSLADAIDAQLSPRFVRHSHPHHMAALAAAMIEQRAVGHGYSQRICDFGRYLSRALVEQDVHLVQDGDRWTETHQVFVRVGESELEDAVRRANAVGLTLNAKRKPLFRSSGLRLGVQELARYEWTLPLLDRLSVVVSSILSDRKPVSEIRAEVLDLAQHNEFDPSLCLPVEGAI